MHFQFKTCFYFKTEREEEIQVRKTDITDKIGDFNLMSQKHWKSNKNWIHCSVIIWRQDGQRKHGGEGAKARQEREKITSTVGWFRKSCNIATARKQKQMSHGSHISHPLPPSLPIHQSALLSPCSHSPDELATIFSFLSPLLLCSHYMFFLLLCFPQTALFPSLSLSFSPPPPSLSGCPELSDYCSSQTTAPSGLIPHLQVWCQPLGQRVVLQPACRQHLVLRWTWLGCTQWTGRKKRLEKECCRLILLSRAQWWGEWVEWYGDNV